MKKLFPIAIIAVFGLMTFASCSKKNSSSSCTCKLPGSGTADTTFSYTAYTGYTSLSASCAASDSVAKLFGTGYGCHM
jgi:hypothetical protein